MVEGHGAGDGGVLRNARGYVSDFLGINYYSRDYIHFRLRPGSLFGDRVPDPSASKSDLGWEIYPEGLFRIAERMWHRFRLPIYITENGTADAEDAFRSSYIASHLAGVARAIEAGVDIRRYNHWSLLDNFEWAEGLTPRFGLYEVDYETQERRLRHSGRLFAEICRRRGADADILERFGLTAAAVR